MQEIYGISIRLPSTSAIHLSTEISQTAFSSVVYCRNIPHGQLFTSLRRVMSTVRSAGQKTSFKRISTAHLHCWKRRGHIGPDSRVKTSSVSVFCTSPPMKCTDHSD